MSGDPGAGYLRAALGLLPGARRPDRLPDRELVRRDVAVDRDHLARYDRVCGFRLGDTLPATYPHVLAFPLAMRLMSAVGLPVPGGRPGARGQPDHRAPRRSTLANAWTWRCARRTCANTTAVGSSTWSRRPRSTANRCGAASRRTCARSAPGERREQRRPATPPAPATARWRIPAGTGGEYAAVSGDRNPIHTSRLGRPAVRLSPADRARHVEPRRAASRRWTAGCPRRTPWTSGSSRRSCCRRRSGSAPTPTIDGWEFRAAR